MHSTPSYFKLKSQLRLAAEYDPSTCIEFELRCNSAASNLRYKTVLPHPEYTPVFTKPSCPGVHRFDHRWLAIQRKPHHRGKRATAARLPAYRPSGVPLTRTEPDETDGAPPRRALI